MTHIGITYTMQVALGPASLLDRLGTYWWQRTPYPTFNGIMLWGYPMGPRQRANWHNQLNDMQECIRTCTLR